jgi:hypothetical protein
MVMRSETASQLISELFQRRPASVSDFADPETSIGQRIHAWETSVEMIAENPLGIGLGMFKRTWARYQPSIAELDAAHNLILDIGVELGVLGVIAFVWIVIDSTRTGLHLVRTSVDPYAGRLALGILSALAGYLAHALSGGAELAHNDLNVPDVPLGSPIATGMLVFWSLLGCLYILRDSERNRCEAPASREVTDSTGEAGVGASKPLGS